MFHLAPLVDAIFDIFFLILIIGIVASWVFPNAAWYKEPLKTIRMICDLVFNPFRNIIPPIGGLDFSPIIPMILIRLIQGVVVDILVKIGL